MSRYLSHPLVVPLLNVPILHSRMVVATGNEARVRHERTLMKHKRRRSHWASSSPNDRVPRRHSHCHLVVLSINLLPRFLLPPEEQ